MSFQVISDRLATLQESNAQLKDLIDRLANLRFQPGSVPLNNDDGNIISELAVEIQQTLKEQGEDFENLQEEVYGQQDKLRKRKQSEEEIEHLDVKVKTAIKELESYVQVPVYTNGIANIFLDTKNIIADLTCKPNATSKRPESRKDSCFYNHIWNHRAIHLRQCLVNHGGRYRTRNSRRKREKLMLVATSLQP